MALLYDALGLRDLAFAELERAFEENSVTLCLLNMDPKMDGLRTDPRFERVYQKALSLSDSLQRLSARV